MYNLTNNLNQTLAGSRQNFTDVLMHYVCLRLQFRSNVFKDEPGTLAPTEHSQSHCPFSH